jgi:hypothetical protein
MMLWVLLLSSLSLGVIAIFVRQIVLEELTSTASGIAQAGAEDLAKHVELTRWRQDLQEEVLLIASDEDHQAVFVMDASGLTPRTR